MRSPGRKLPDRGVAEGGGAAGRARRTTGTHRLSLPSSVVLVIEELLERLVRLGDRGVDVTTGDGDDDRVADDLARLGDGDHTRTVVAATGLRADGDGLGELLREAGDALGGLPHRGARGRNTGDLHLERHLGAGEPLDERPGEVLLVGVVVDAERPRRDVVGQRT